MYYSFFQCQSHYRVSSFFFIIGGEMGMCSREETTGGKRSVSDDFQNQGKHRNRNNACTDFHEQGCLLNGGI